MTDAPQNPPLLPSSGVPGPSIRPPAVPPAPLTLRTAAGGERPDGNFYEQIGGRATFERLVREFYRGCLLYTSDAADE